MEALHKRPVKEEMKPDFNAGDGGLIKKYVAEKSSLHDTASSSTALATSDTKDTVNNKTKEELLESAREEMGGLKQENERLKTVLSRIMKDYESLQNEFNAISQKQRQLQEENQIIPPAADHDMSTDQEDQETDQLLSLSLGGIKSTTATNYSKESRDGEKKTDEIGCGEELSLALQCSSKMEGSTSGDQSFDEVVQKDEEEEDGGGQWPPNKAQGKASRSSEDELSQLVQVKKARVSVRARCEAPTMNDGCQWRKYGQKISKGNPCPRAYYRCTVAPACPVRKQVQRCADDMSILITTYEGTHNHPLPLAATTIASTTSAAASMLLSPSSSSASTLAATNLSFGLTQAPKPPPSPFHQLSAAPSQPPVITLDLTSPNPQFNTGATLGYSSYPSLASGYFNKYTSQLSGNRNLNLSPNPSFSSYLPKNPSSSSAQQEGLTESLARAITSDPSFKSALAEALTSIVGGEGDSMPSGAGNYHLKRPSPALAASLGFLNGKSSSSMQNRDRLNL